MANKNDCINLYRKYGNVTDVIYDLDIDIQETEFKQKTLESRIVINAYGDATIFVRSDINEYYKNFLLAHELGHFILHYDKDISFNYYCRVYKTKLEREANDFACDLLLSDVDFSNVYDIEFISKEKGIPDKIWYSYLENKKFNTKVV